MDDEECHCNPDGSGCDTPTCDYCEDETLTCRIADEVLQLNRCRIESGDGYSTLFRPLTNPVHLQLVEDEVERRFDYISMIYEDGEWFIMIGHHWAEDKSKPRAFLNACLAAVGGGE